MSKTGLFVGSALLAGVSFAALAEDQPLDTRWYLSPNATYVVGDDDRHADDAFGFQAMIGKAISDHLNLELNAKVQDFDLHGSNDHDKQRGLSLDGLFFFNRNPTFAPYAILGAGALYNVIPGNNEWNPAVEAGLGFWHQVDEDGAQFRAEVRHRYEWAKDTDALTCIRGTRCGGDNFNDWIVSLGFVIPIGSRPHAAPAPRPQPVIAAQPAPAPVAPRVETQTVILEGVNFCFDCDTLSPQSKAVLDGNARKIINEASSTATFEIAGHTDAVGSDAYNLDLSGRRAQNVRAYLVQQGVDGVRLGARGYGETQPVADNATAVGRSKNRRVELRVTQ